jgi:uncharacterized protein YdhG (YjbR/CyaY superfamily)
VPTKPRSIDDYLSRLTTDKRAALEKLRRAIKAAAPGVEECISYQLPAFRHDGKIIVWFGAATNHCSFYPGAAPIATHAAELASYETSKGTIRFDPKEPLPATLVRKLVRSRIAEASKGETEGRARRRARRPAHG